MHWKRLCAVVGIVSLHLLAERAMGQSPTPASPYPANDTPVTLRSGTVVRVRNVVVFAGPRGKALTLYIQSPTSASDSVRLAREAKELVDLHDASGALGPLTRATVGVCRTQACLEMREVPSEMFFFLAQPDGSWRAVARPAP
jgi:hypothetical protein